MATKEKSAESSYTKTTVKETRTVKSESDPLRVYRPIIAPKNFIIHRSIQGTGGRGNVVAERSMKMSASYGAPSGAYGAVVSTGVGEVQQSHEKEKKDMQDLNERLANYIEKVRFLEAHNKKQQDELEKLKDKWGKETGNVKAMYIAELEEARRLLEEANKEKGILELKRHAAEEIMEETLKKYEEASKAANDMKEKIDHQNQQLSEYEAEISLLRRRVESLEQERDRERKKVGALQDAANNARADLSNETLLHMDAENRCESAREELAFLKAVHEQEIKELSALAFRDTTSENREFWKNEMGQALREIQQLYEDKLEGIRSELETHYSLKVQEFSTGATKQNLEAHHSKEECKRLKTQMADHRDKLSDLEAKNAALLRELEFLRREKDEKERELDEENSHLKIEVAKLKAEMESIVKELHLIINTKMGLELEIAAYRKLLEGEESRVGLRQLVQQVVTTQEEQSKVIKGEMAAKTTYQRSAKGPVAIAECSPDGKFIVIENTGRKDEELKDWKLKRTVDGKDKEDFLFSAVAIKPNDKIKIYAKGTKPSDAPKSDLESAIANWGVGSNITTKLVNPTGEDRATHVQKTTYS